MVLGCFGSGGSVLLNLIKDGVHLCGIVQHSNIAPKFCQPSMAFQLQRSGPLSRCLHLHEAHGSARQQHQPIRSSRPIAGRELQTKTAAICGGLAKFQFYFTFSYVYHTPFFFTLCSMEFEGSPPISYPAPMGEGFAQRHPFKMGMDKGSRKTVMDRRSFKTEMDRRSSMVGMDKLPPQNGDGWSIKRRSQDGQTRPCRILFS